MADIANLQFRADTGDISNATNALDQLAQTAAKTEKAANSLGSSVSNVGKGGTSGLKVTKQELDALLNSLNPTSKAFDELDRAMQTLQAARGQKLIGAEQFADFSAIIDKQRASLQRTYDDLTGYTDQVRASEAAQKQAAATRQADIASLDRLRAVLNPAGEAAKKLQEQFSLLERARLSGTLGAKEYGELRQQLTGLNKEVKESTLSAGQLQAGWGNATQQFIDLGVQLQGGANPITALIQQGPQLAYAFGSVGGTLEAFKQQFTEVAKNFGFGADTIEDQASDITDSVGGISESLNDTVDASKNVAAGFARFITPMTLAITAVVAGIAYLGYQAYKSATQMDTLQKAINSTGNIAGVTSRQLSSLADGLADIGDGGRDAAVQATAIATAFSTSTEQIERYARAALTVSDATGEAVDDILAQFKRLAKDPVQALITLNDQYHFANAALYDHVKALDDAGKETEAMGLVVDALQKSIKDLGEQTQSSISNATGFWDSLDASIRNAFNSTQEYKDAFSQYNPDGYKTGSAVFDTINNDQQQSAEKTKNNFKTLSQYAENLLGFVTETGAKQKKFNDEYVKSNSTADAFLKTARTNEQIRADYTKKWKKDLDAGLITQQKYNSLVTAVNEKYKDPKTPKTPGVKVDEGDKITEQFLAQNIALDAQIQLLKNRSAFETNASKERKSYLELEAKYTVLEQASTERKLTKQEQQMLAVKNEALAQARILADKGDQLVTLQRQAQVQDEISKMAATQAAQAEVYAKYQGVSSKELQRQLELAQARAAVLAKGGTAKQADAAAQIKQIDFDQADARAQDWIAGMKTGLADWADSVSNYAKIAGDAVQKGMQMASNAVSDFVTTGKFDFADFTKSILKMIVDIIAQLLVLKAVKAGAGAAGFGGLFANANGGVYNDPSLSKYSNGVYSSPQFFSFGGRSQFANGGVFAEAGPEAIMPLSRDSNGRLGVKAEGAGGGGITVNQNVNISSDGSARVSTTADAATGRAVGDQLSAVVTQEVAKMMRPGGLLFRAYGS